MPTNNLREAVARIIDPTAFCPMTGHVPIQRQENALAKADAILSLLTPSDQANKSVADD